MEKVFTRAELSRGMEYEKEYIEKAAAYIKNQSAVTPTIGLILGSGLGVLADEIEGAVKFRTTTFLSSRFQQLKVTQVN